MTHLFCDHLLLLKAVPADGYRYPRKLFPMACYICLDLVRLLRGSYVALVL